MNYGMQKPIKTKADIEMFLAMCLRVDPSQLTFTKLSDKPTLWKHACMHVGVVGVQVPASVLLNTGVPVYYIFCNRCGKVTYYVDGY